MNKLVVISGCFSGGKSTLLSELRSRGYATVSEVPREIVKEQLAVGGDITPWQKPIEFCELLIERSIAAYKLAQEMTGVMGGVVFLDRSFLEGVSYYQTLKIKGAHRYDHFVDELRYYPTIFIAPPWKEIFFQDEERQNTFENAVTEYERDLKFYSQCGYRAVELPKISVKERAEFILSIL
jgi:predicted ATPase